MVQLMFYKRLAYLEEKDHVEFECCDVMGLLSLEFSLLQSAITCLRGARSHHGCPANYCLLDLALAKGQVCDRSGM